MKNKRKYFCFFFKQTMLRIRSLPKRFFCLLRLAILIAQRCLSCCNWVRLRGTPSIFFCSVTPRLSEKNEFFDAAVKRTLTFFPPTLIKLFHNFFFSSSHIRAAISPAPPPPGIFIYYYLGAQLIRKIAPESMCVCIYEAINGKSTFQQPPPTPLLKGSLINDIHPPHFAL